MSTRTINKLHRQYARLRLQDTIAFAEFIHKLNNRLCAVQGTSQIALAKGNGFEHSLSHIEAIVLNTGEAVQQISKRLYPKQKRQRAQNVAV